MKYQLVPPDNEQFKSKLEDFDFQGDVDPVELANDLREIMEANRGVGLAANQVGLDHRVCVFATDPPLTMYNPNIVYYNDNHEIAEEGCLTHPGLFIKVRRPNGIRVRYKDENGVLQTNVFNGQLARIIQHEVDHLNGIDFLERASNIHLQQAKRKQKLYQRKVKKLAKVLA